MHASLARNTSARELAEIAMEERDHERAPAHAERVLPISEAEWLAARSDG
jgi:hypothetical protein